MAYNGDIARTIAEQVKVDILTQSQEEVTCHIKLDGDARISSRNARFRTTSSG